MNQEQMAYLEPRVFIADIDSDQKSDIIVLENNGLSVYQQQKNGKFSTVRMRLNLPFKVSARPWWLQRTANGDAIDQRNIEHRMLEYLQDLNADGIADMMLSNTSSSGVLDKAVSHEIYYGRLINGQLAFQLPADSIVTTGGTFSGVELVDLNADQKNELLISSFKIGIGQIIGALLSGSVDQDVYLYAPTSQGQYPSRADFAAEVDLKFSLSSGRTGQPVILTADLDGDSKRELILSRSSKMLAVYTPSKGKKLFKSRPGIERLRLPENGNMITVADLDGDNADELLIHYGREDAEELRRSVVVLHHLH